MKENILFFIIILLANIIQGVTGFAGTILAMPASLLLVGYNTAVPILNLLGFFSGVYVFVLNRKEVQFKELGKVLAVMAPMIFAGLWLKKYMEQYDKAIYIVLGVLVLILAITGLYKMLLKFPKDTLSSQEEKKETKAETISNVALLVASGIVHGMFVCGGPLLISYLTKRVKENGAFRATISTVWIVLNGLIFISHIKAGLWSKNTIEICALSFPFLIGGMFIGGILYKKMSRKAFMILTYVLLFISGISLLLK